MFFFNEITEVPFDDLDAIESYSWDVAAPHAYPIPCVKAAGKTLKRPDHRDILWYQAALQAIPIFVRHHLMFDRNGIPQPGEADIPIRTTNGQVMVKIKSNERFLPTYSPSTFIDPGDTEAEFEMPFDRRAMEGDLAHFLGSLGTQDLDPDVTEAQELMYQVWEESNPAKRINLAHKALKISPDCTDAYVLLAQEEADTIQRAMEYYQQGVIAGERALGQEYFKENVGYFWGLLETRPYMRAMEGLAHCKWNLDQKDEALRIYQEMLRLNPGDNQGIRYVLADLLLYINRDEQLEMLMGEYEDDATAVWLYTEALLAFRKEGASAKAKEALICALEQDTFVPYYLTGMKKIPNRVPETIGWGDEREAIRYAADHLNYWRRTPGAVQWLKDTLFSL